MNLSWNMIIDTIQDVTQLLAKGDFSQPLKPYLRYGNDINRIIAMPAYVGGPIAVAGIKWIASFPGNVKLDLPRANSVTILNEASTGIPKCIINTSLISEIRTAAVSGLLVRQYIRKRKLTHYNIGIVGFGPIGRRHLAMLCNLLQNESYTVHIFDLKMQQVNTDPDLNNENIRIVSTWEESYLNMDLFFTCTVSTDRYIDKRPKTGSLLLNVSLRDFKPFTLDYIDQIIVDDWEEVCRQNTDIELMHRQKGLQKTGTLPFAEVINSDFFERIADTDVIMFNPMGMAVFDIAIANAFYQAAQQQGIGQTLND